MMRNQHVRAFLFLGNKYRDRRIDPDGYRHALDAYAALVGKPVAEVEAGLLEHAEVWGTP
jgi:hypothetical protein